MRQVQKRYLYAGIIGAVFFVISYGIMNINIFISLVLTMAIYMGGVFLFKGKDIREFTPENVDAYYFVASKCANLANYIDEVEIKKHVEKITTYTDEIILSLSQRPKKVEQVFDFFDYYLDITYKILLKYNMIIKSKNKTPHDKVFLNSTKEFLEKISMAFEKQLANMKEARMLDIESEIRIFEKTVGIKKSDVEVGEQNELK